MGRLKDKIFSITRCLLSLIITNKPLLWDIEIDTWTPVWCIQHYNYCQTLKSRLQIRKVCILMFSHLVSVMLGPTCKCYSLSKHKYLWQCSHDTSPAPVRDARLIQNCHRPRSSPAVDLHKIWSLHHIILNINGCNSDNLPQYFKFIHSFEYWKCERVPIMAQVWPVTKDYLMQ